MPESEARREWTAKNTTSISLKLNNHTDADILTRLAKVESRQGYIKSLIRDDIKQEEQK